MKVVILQCGKTNSKAVQQICAEYLKRLQRYIKVQELTLPDLKNTKSLSQQQVKAEESRQILGELKPGDRVVLLDENGREYTSVKFARQLQTFMNAGPKRLVFIIGGPYGFSEEVYAVAHHQVALSRMTFSHQIIRAIFTEQLYRAFSILNNDPYHHQ